MRSIRSLLIISLLCLFLGIASAAFSLDEFIAQFQSASANLSLVEKKSYYLKVYNNMSLLAIKNRTTTQQYEFYTSLKDYVQNQITILGVPTDSLVVASGMIIPKVDLVKVRDVWLTLHNTERKTKSLTPYTYTSALEGTATTRAEHLTDLGKATHKRKSTDGYYSYTSIKQRFINQGITFAGKEKNGQALFTENLGRGYYTCKQADCTDGFIKAIKTSRSFFMSEKGRSSRPHYNAIMGNFSNVGLGVAVAGNKYYLVTHYTQALK